MGDASTPQHSRPGGLLVGVRTGPHIVTNISMPFPIVAESGFLCSYFCAGGMLRSEE